MACAREIHVQSDNLTECGICLGLINDPKALPCLHVFCSGCLEEWTKEQVDKTHVKCPVCKEDFELSQGGESGLHPGLHFFVSTLKEKEVLQSNLKKERLCCTSCYEYDNIAISWCLYCSAKLCENCVKCHKMLKLFEGHKLYALDDIRADKVDVRKVKLKRFCKKHEDQVPRFFCETCGVLICRDCTVVDHPMTKHTLVNVEEISGEQLNMVTDLTDRCRNVSSKIDDKIKEVTDVQKDLEEALKKARAEAHRSVQQIKADFLTNLERQCQKVMKDIDECGNNVKVKLLEEKNQLERQSLQLNRALTFSKSLCENGSPYDLAAVFTPLMDTMKRLGDLKLDEVQKDLSEVTFVPVDEYAVPVPLFGYVSYINRTPGYQDMSGDWILERKLGEGTFNNGVGIAISSNKHHFAVGCYNIRDQLKLFDSNGTFLNQINDTGTDVENSKVWGVAITVDDSLIITDRSEFVKIIDSKLKLVHKFITIPPKPKSNLVGNSLKGVALNGKHLFIGETRHKYISVHKVCGEHLKSFNVNIEPQFISVSPNGNQIVVSTMEDLHVISCNDGQILHSFPRSAVALPGATGSVFNGNNEFIICKQIIRSSQPGIYRYRIDGKYLGCITTDVKNPTDVVISEDGKLVVLEWSHIKIFKRK